MGRLYVFGRRVVVRGLRVLRRLAACRVYVPLRHVAMDRLYVHVHVRGVVAVQLCVLDRLAACGVYVPLWHVAADRLYVHVRRIVAV